MKQTKSSTEKNDEYIQKLASSLPKFEKVKDGVYKFRCVFCGDSKKNPNKRSGYFYLINHSQNYRCFKCNHRSSLKNVLKVLKPELYMEYLEEGRSKRLSEADNMIWVDRIYKNSQTSSSDEVKDKMRKMRERRLEEKVKEQQKE